MNKSGHERLDGGSSSSESSLGLWKAHLGAAGKSVSIGGVTSASAWDGPGTGSRLGGGGRQGSPRGCNVAEGLS